MVTMKGLTLWVKCPKQEGYRSVQYCLKCDYYAGSMNDEIMCIWDEK